MLAVECCQVEHFAPTTSRVSTMPSVSSPMQRKHLHDSMLELILHRSVATVFRDAPTDSAHDEVLLAHSLILNWYSG